MRKNVKIALLVIIIFSVLSLLSSILLTIIKNPQNSLSILGPSDKPAFDKMQWKTVKITYWIRKADTKNYRKNKRTITITMKSTIEELKTAFLIKKLEPSPIGASKQILITMKDGTTWKGDIVFEDRIDLCLQSDNYYSYCLYLVDEKFYIKILQLCFKNEKKTAPEILEKDILLRQNKY